MIAVRGLSLKKVALRTAPLILIIILLMNVQTEIRKNPVLLFQSNQNLISRKVYDFFRYFNAYPHFLEILTKFPDVYDYIYGKSIFNVLTNFIPRSVWKNKPVGFGKFLAVDIYGAHKSVSFAGTIIGEAYANGSWIGVVLILFALGIVAKFFYCMFKKSKVDIIGITFYLTVLFHFLTVVRGRK